MVSTHHSILVSEVHSNLQSNCCFLNAETQLPTFFRLHFVKLTDLPDFKECTCIAGEDC